MPRKTGTLHVYDNISLNSFSNEKYFTQRRNFDIRGSVHRRLLSRNTNKMLFVIEFIIPKFFKGSTCFERHAAHHQEL